MFLSLLSFLCSAVVSGSVWLGSFPRLLSFTFSVSFASAQKRATFYDCSELKSFYAMEWKE
jgi:hypothetical protein